MRLPVVALACFLGAVAHAQVTLDRPLADPAPYHLDSGMQANLSPGAQTVFSDVVGRKGIGGIRVYFGEVSLEPGSYIRVTSHLDGEVQILDSGALAMWRNSTAYFNGDRVTVELIAAPGTANNRLVVERIGVQEPHQPAGSCGICGPDDRVPSDEEWSCRMLPAGCTASVWNTDSCLVSAGHCISGNDVVQFRVPDSLANCNIVNPPIAEQFPTINVDFVNGGVGNDWAVLTSGTNNQGQTAYDRYGVLRPIADAPPQVGQAVAVWGYGVDDQCTRSQTQQFDDGTIASVFTNYVEHFVDVTFGNSGSGLIRSGEIIAIITHCPCPGAATRVDRANFTAAREDLCPGGGGEDCPWDLDGNGSVGTSDLLDLLSQWGTFPGGPPDFDGGGVGTSDLLELLSNWGGCP